MSRDESRRETHDKEEGLCDRGRISIRAKIMKNAKNTRERIQFAIKSLVPHPAPSPPLPPSPRVQAHGSSNLT